MNWQPIETAPKDGSWILLTGGKTEEDDYLNEGVQVQRPVVAFWDADAQIWGGDDEDAVDTVGGWAFCFWDGAWRTGYQNPTHWMQLPEAPARGMSAGTAEIAQQAQAEGRQPGPKDAP